MRTITFILVFTFIGLSCEKNTSLLEYTSEKVKFYTDAGSYHEKDSIDLFLENNSSNDLITGLRCGQYLEMGYQMKEKDEWSAEKYFWYAQLDCPTLIDTIEANSTYKYTFSATLFDTTGTFRLFLPYYIPEKDTSFTVVSNSFDVY